MQLGVCEEEKAKKDFQRKEASGNVTDLCKCLRTDGPLCCAKTNASRTCRPPTTTPPLTTKAAADDGDDSDDDVATDDADDDAVAEGACGGTHKRATRGRCKILEGSARVVRPFSCALPGATPFPL